MHETQKITRVMADVPSPKDERSNVAVLSDTVSIGAVRRMAALLNHDPSTFETGSVVPAYWYQFLCTPAHRTRDLAQDGHPKTNDPVVPEGYPRRMFAGRRVAFSGALVVGADVVRTSMVKSQQMRIGSSGPLCFVTMQHELVSRDGRLKVVEEQDIVYRAPAQAPKMADRLLKKTVMDLPEAQASASWRPTTPELFRYSALTFNSHKIHYDGAYACEREGYPGLIVNGGLTTLMLWEFVHATWGRELLSSASRNTKPLYAEQAVALNVAASGDIVTAWACDAHGDLAVHMELELGEPA